MSSADPTEAPQPVRFMADLEAKPAALEGLARLLAAGGASRLVGAALPRTPGFPARIVLLGMGSSRYAAQVAALRMRSHGLAASAEYASATAGQPPGPDVLAVAISATGESAETMAAAERHTGRSHLLAITNAPDSSLARLADAVIPMGAGREVGEVACRTFQHTGLLLEALTRHLAGMPEPVDGLVMRVAEASADLLSGREQWLPVVAEVLDGPQGTWFLAPAERLSSADQSALMVREGPRRPADACETGDWSHVDVYLTRTLQYRAVLFAGSRWDAPAVDWLRRRGSRWVAVGVPHPDADARVRYIHDDDADVALHTETLVAELLAAHWWRATLAQR